MIYYTKQKSVVRLAAVQTLYRLFTDVGEEYLILLPESLPYLSELLEEDAPDILEATVKLIKFIEELSGCFKRPRYVRACISTNREVYRNNQIIPQ